MSNLTFTGVSHLELYVTDLDASVAWYESAVSLSPRARQPEQVVVLQPANGTFRLVLRPGRPADAHGDFGHVALAVDSLQALQAWTEHLDEIGVPHKGIHEGPTGYTVDLVDPDGHDIELTYEP
jgi:catechol 2,3-dioxygenase-like lactoylglutathione lyase family enzyme